MTISLEIKNNLDAIRDYLYGGGYPDPLSNAEQLSFLFYFNVAEDIDHNNLLIDKKYKSIFSGNWKLKNPINSKNRLRQYKLTKKTD